MHIFYQEMENLQKNIYLTLFINKNLHVNKTQIKKKRTYIF